MYRNDRENTDRNGKQVAIGRQMGGNQPAIRRQARGNRWQKTGKAPKFNLARLLLTFIIITR